MAQKITTGADVMLSALADSGVSICFANPGTTELDIIRALERQENIRCVIGLQENVCTGAADGYGRMSGKPAATLLHLGPGFANGVANLHNAKRAHTPIVNLIGDHTSWHLAYDAPLTSDIESLASPVSGWTHRITSLADVGTSSKAAVARSQDNGGQSATLIFPADFQYGATDPSMHSAEPVVDTKKAASTFDLQNCAARLKDSKHTVFLLGGGGVASGLGERAQKAVARLCSLLGASAYAETFPSRSERGQGLPAFDRLPYFPEPARAVLDPASLVVLAGALAPVTYFGYEGQPSRLVTDDRLLLLSQAGEDVASRLEQLAELLQADPYVPQVRALPVWRDEGLTPAGVAAVLAQELPENAIVSVEGGTCGYPFYAASCAAKPHTTLTNTGGAIGQGLPVAMGAAMACPNRQVVALVSDGSTQYTIQTLWSMAHEALEVVVLVTANHQYAILRNELRRGGSALGAKAAAMTSLDNPRIDWVGLAQAYGVPSSRAATTQELQTQLHEALSRRGPTLIEMTL